MSDTTSLHADNFSLTETAHVAPLIAAALLVAALLVLVLCLLIRCRRRRGTANVLYYGRDNFLFTK